MKQFVLKAAVVAAVVVAMLAGRARAADKPEGMKIGLVQGLFRDVQPGMMQALARPFRELMCKQIGTDGEVEICPDPLVLAELMKEKKLQLGVFHGFEYAWAQKKCPDLCPLVVTLPAGGKVQAFILTQKDCPCKKVADLRDAAIVIPRGAKSHALAFLNKTRDGLAPTTARPLVKLTLTAEDALNAVVAGDATAVLIDSAAWEGYQTLQPGASKQLKILAESEQFPAAVIAYHKDALSRDQVGTIRDGLSSAQKTSTGKMLMALWNLKGFQAAPEDFQSQLDNILLAYPCPQKAESADLLRTHSLQPK